MAIPGISKVLLQTPFVAFPVAEQKPAKKNPKTGPRFIAFMALYLNTLHELIMKSWSKFAEAQKDIAQENAADHRIHQVREAELEGQRKQVEIFKQEQEGELVRCGIHRQAGKFRFYEGQHFGEGFDHRHLHIAI